MKSNLYISNNTSVDLFQAEQKHYLDLMNGTMLTKLKSLYYKYLDRNHLDPFQTEFKKWMYENMFSISPGQYYFSVLDGFSCMRFIEDLEPLQNVIIEDIDLDEYQFYDGMIYIDLRCTRAILYIDQTLYFLNRKDISQLLQYRIQSGVLIKAYHSEL